MCKIISKAKAYIVLLCVLWSSGCKNGFYSFYGFPHIEADDPSKQEQLNEEVYHATPYRGNIHLQQVGSNRGLDGKPKKTTWELLVWAEIKEANIPPLEWRCKFLAHFPCVISRAGNERMTRIVVRDDLDGEMWSLSVLYNKKSRSLCILGLNGRFKERDPLQQ